MRETALPATKTLLIGLGANRCGTTWLHGMLRQHPDCYLRARKETHYWDQMASGRWGWREKALKAALPGMQRRAKRDRSPELAERIADTTELLRISASRDLPVEEYLRYLWNGRPEPLLADITPAYGLLPPEWLARMAASHGDTRFVLLLRDPVARLWSNAKMAAGKTRPDFDDAAARTTLAEALDGTNANLLARSDYRAMLENIGAALRPQQFHIAFYERLFGQTALDALTGFLGIAPFRQIDDARLHASPGAGLSPELRRRAYAALQPQYEYCDAYFGPRLPQQWRDTIAACAN